MKTTFSQLSQFGTRSFQQRGLPLNIGLNDVILEKGLASFYDDDGNTPLKSLKLKFNPEQNGSGEPSLENIREINPYQTAKAILTTKNLLTLPYKYNIWSNRGIDYITQNDGSVKAAGSVTNTSQPYMVLLSFVLKPKVKYTISHGCTHPYGFAVAYFKSGGVTIVPDGYDVDLDHAISTTYISSLNNNTFRKKRTFYVNTPCAIEFQLRFSGTTPLIDPYDVTDAIFHPMIEINGEGDWDIEPTWERVEFKRIDIAFDLDDNFYAGVLDLISGELKIEYAYYEFDGSVDEDWRRLATSPSGEYRMALYDSDVPNYVQNGYSGIPNTPKNVILSNQFPEAWEVSSSNNNSPYYKHESIALATAENAHFIQMYRHDYQTIEAWTAYLEEHPLQVLVKLPTPITYQLTPVEIRSLVGANTVYINNNDVPTVDIIELS